MTQATRQTQFVLLAPTYHGELDPGVYSFWFSGELYDNLIGNTREADIGRTRPSSVEIYGENDFYWFEGQQPQLMLEGFVRCSDAQFRYALDYNEFVRKHNPFNHLYRLEPFPPCFFFEAFWVWAQSDALAADGDHAIAYRVMRCLFRCKAP